MQNQQLHAGSQRSAWALTAVLQQGQEGYGGADLADDGLDLCCDLLFWPLLRVPAHDYDEELASVYLPDPVAAMQSCCGSAEHATLGDACAAILKSIQLAEGKKNVRTSQ